MFAALSGVSSLRELSNVMLACEGKINHLNKQHFPRRSTISDGNANRPSEVFGEIYHRLLKRYRSFLSDSSPRMPVVKDLLVIDSTTISLFTDILKDPGRPPLVGKKKGGIKMHTMINVLEDVPQVGLLQYGRSYSVSPDELYRFVQFSEGFRAVLAAADNKTTGPTYSVRVTRGVMPSVLLKNNHLD